MVCLLLDFALKILTQKSSTFSGLAELKCNTYIRGFFNKEMATTSTQGVHIFKIVTLGLCVYLLYWIRITSYFHKQLKLNLPETIQVLLHTLTQFILWFMVG